MKINRIFLILIGFILSVPSALAVKGHGRDDGPKEDLVTKGPGKVIYHYACEGELVKITRCDVEQAINKASDCVGPSSTISKTDFINRAQSKITIKNDQNLKPLNAKEVASFRFSQENNLASKQERKEFL